MKSSAIRTSGTNAGYDGYVRHYVLESKANLTGGTWNSVPNYTNVIGNNQFVQYTTTQTNLTFFRGRIWLDKP